MTGCIFMDTCHIAPSTIEYLDRALHYGDGCFTTIYVRKGMPQLLAQHIERLSMACGRLGIDFHEADHLETQLKNASEGVAEGVIKVIVSRGKGGRGYSPQGSGPTQVYLSHHPYPSHYKDWQRNGVSLGISDIKLAKQPLLAGIKHLNRLEQVLIKASPQARQYDDLLVCDTDLMLVEASAGNVFWKVQDIWFTPCLSSSGVEGVMRNRIVRHLKQQNNRVDIVRAPLSSLLSSDAAFICNSLMGIVPIVSVHNEDQNKHFPSAEVTQLWKDVQANDI